MGKIKILFVFRTPMENIGLINDEKVSEPSEFLWGMKDLDRTKYEVRFINAPRFGKRTGIRRFTWFFEVAFAKYTRIGLPLDIYLKYRKDLLWADEIVCTYDQVSVGILFWRLCGALKGKKIHAIVMSFSERIKYFEHIQPLRWFVSALLRQANSILTLSEVASDTLALKFKLDRKKIYTWYFGIDTSFWVQERHDVIYNIMSIGNDMNRDFATLIGALRYDEKAVFITNKHVEYDQEKKYITILSGISNAEVRTCYSQSTIVVIPSFPLQTESSGLSCVLQALACGRPVIVSDAPPFRELFEDEIHCLFYTPGSVEDLRKKIDLLKNNEDLAKKIAIQGHKLVLERYTCKVMSDQLNYILKLS
ncbi:MAG TPA: hypothetical protein DCS29_00850 [Candidatus Magasanikbacteria bacterium]|nr:MAG: hypothetical protein A2479_03305 [Candidatus Magasanikbacteria bacterium RIFOXYC2_FULL_39_8]HAT03311.1 hypothetical protein [Candidatus Magasanikbacteria bacterium]